MNRVRKKRLKDNLVGWAFVLPSFLILLVFTLIPIVMSVYYSFTEYNVLEPAKWVGLSNYIRLFSDRVVVSSMKNTFFYTLLTVPLQTILSLVIGALIAERFQNTFGRACKGAMFVPVISSSVLVGTIWTMLFATDNGIINGILGAVGIDKINWLGQRSTALLCVCVVAVWKNVGYFLVIYFAGLMNVPQSYYEAAEVDGATRLQRFFHITLPCIKPITYLVVTLGIIWSFQVFDLVYSMTSGGPGNATSTLVLTIYQKGFREYRMGYASAIAIVLFLFILLVNRIQRMFFREKE
ncbi:MAG: sugar ABC transporter permease [Eubacteriales bacterium]|nr:sugar ABC transporter permease [Eubacteriales bacterium]